MLNLEKKELERRSDDFQNEVKQLNYKLSRLEEIEREKMKIILTISVNYMMQTS